MTTERCTCGDTACPWCGTAQGTYQAPESPDGPDVEAPEGDAEEVICAACNGPYSVKHGCDCQGNDKPVAITEDRYREACDGSEGWCDVCGDFTRDCTEPDAKGYRCPQCETVNSVCGAEQALLKGKITFGGEE